MELISVRKAGETFKNTPTGMIQIFTYLWNVRFFCQLHPTVILFKHARILDMILMSLHLETLNQNKLVKS